MVAVLAVTGLLIAAVVMLGSRVDLGRDFTRSLLRMFVCWTPQLVIMSLVVSIWNSNMQRIHRDKGSIGDGERVS